jgi:gas vesicle protein
MIRLASWLLGFSIGASFGALIVMLFVPATAAEVRYRLRAGYEETMEAARLASEKRRRELEAQLAQKQGRALPVPVTHRDS